MFTGPVGPVEFFYRPEAIFGNFYWPRTSSSLLASSPDCTSPLSNRVIISLYFISMVWCYHSSFLFDLYFGAKNQQKYSIEKWYGLYCIVLQIANWG